MIGNNPAMSQLSNVYQKRKLQQEASIPTRMDYMANLTYARTNGQKKILGAPGKVNAYSDINGVRYFFNTEDMDRVLKDNPVVNSEEIGTLRTRAKRGDKLNDEEWMRHLWLDPLNNGSHDVYRTSAATNRPVTYSE